jgi:hypothetical protein
MNKPGRLALSRHHCTATQLNPFLRFKVRQRRSFLAASRVSLQWTADVDYLFVEVVAFFLFANVEVVVY